LTGLPVHRLEDPKRPYERDVITLDDAVKLVQSLPAEIRVFISTLGTYHNIWGLLRSGQAFDFLLDAGDDPDPAAEVRIPHRAMASAFQRHLVKPTLVRKIQAVAKSRAALLSTPPPKQSNEFMLDRFMKQKSRRIEESVLRKSAWKRPESRLKLWLMETRAMAAWCASENLDFVPAPAGAFDVNGFLHPRFYSDATHANAKYGALVIDQICTIVEESGKMSASG